MKGFGPALLITTHGQARRRLPDGLAALVLSLRALDGDAVPWLRIERVDATRWVDVVGAAPGRVRVEVHAAGRREPCGVALIGRDYRRWELMPPACHPWVWACRSDEALNAGLAASAAWAWLRGIELGGMVGLRPRQYGVREAG